MPIDIMFIAAFGYGFWQGYSRGIIGTVLNMLAYIFGFTIAFKFTPATTGFLKEMFNSDNPTMFLAAFVVNLVFIMLILRFIIRSFEGAVRSAYLGVVNQVLGGALLGGFAVVIYSILLWFAVKAQFINTATVDESRSYPFLKDLPIKAKAVALRFQPLATDFWDDSMKWINTLNQYGSDKKTDSTQKLYEPTGESKPIEDDPAETTRPKRPTYTEDSDGIEE